MTEVRDTRGHFEGFEPRECRDHRTVGTYRAWCHDCAEWCYPSSPCARCELPMLRRIVATTRAMVYSGCTDATFGDVMAAVDRYEQVIGETPREPAVTDPDTRRTARP